MLKVLMNDGAHVVAIESERFSRRANFTIKKREMYGDKPDDYEDVEVCIPIDKTEAKQIIKGLQEFVGNDS